MASSEVLDLRDELLEKESELSSMQNLLLEQDEDIRACQQRLGELESTLLLACHPKFTANSTGECLGPHSPASSHPVQRSLYERAFIEAATTSDTEEEQSEDANEKTLYSCSCQEASGGGERVPSTPEPTEEGKSAGSERPPQLDIYGRRLDRSFRTQDEAKEPTADTIICETVRADAGSGVSQQPRFGGRPITAGSVGLEERQAEAAEAAAREAAAAMTAANEAKAAKDEAKRLRAEGAELSRWREAVLNVRDALEIAQGEGQGAGDGNREGRRTHEDDPVARHAKWVSSPALKTLLSRVHQNARDLLTNLAMARGAAPSAATVTPHVAVKPHADDDIQVEPTRLAAAMGEPLGEVDSRMDADNGRETSATSQDVATAGIQVEKDEVERQFTSSRKECKTLRIVIQAMREKDEESQKRIAALEGEVFQASLLAVKQEALISTLRRQLEMNQPYDAQGPQPHLLTPRHTELAGERSAAVISAKVQGDALAINAPYQRVSRLSVSLSPPRRNNAGIRSLHGDVSPGRSCCHSADSTARLVATPVAQCSLHDRRRVGVGTTGGDVDGGNSAVDNTNGVTSEVEVGTRLHLSVHPRTPTTDILRRLLYENTPRSSTHCAAECGEKTERIADQEHPDNSDHTARRSRNGRRLFAEGSTVLRSCPAASGDATGARRGPAALFSDLLCGTGVEEVSKTGTRDCSGVSVVREGGENGVGKATGEQGVVREARSDEVEEQKGGRLATGEIVLRDRLLRAREEFSALRTGASIDSS